jgi:hypothetical protein
VVSLIRVSSIRSVLMISSSFIHIRILSLQLEDANGKMINFTLHLLSANPRNS